MLKIYFLLLIYIISFGINAKERKNYVELLIPTVSDHTEVSPSQIGQIVLDTNTHSLWLFRTDASGTPKWVDITSATYPMGNAFQIDPEEFELLVKTDSDTLVELGLDEDVIESLIFKI